MQSDELGVDDLHLLWALEAPVHTLCRPSLSPTPIPTAFTSSLTSGDSTAAVSTDTTGIDVVIIIVRVFDLIVLIDSSDSLGRSLRSMVATTSKLVIVIFIIVLVVVIVVIIMIVIVSRLAVLSELDLYIHTCIERIVYKSI